MAKNYKTIALTGTEQKVVLAGQNCDIRNDSVDVVYASAEAGITSGADGVLSIPAGQAAKLLDCRGTLYILGTGSVMLCGNDYSELVFKTAATSSGEGGIDQGARDSINAHAGNADIHFTAEKVIEAAATAISNPNQLVNSWFGNGVINQRGFSEYSENAVTYTIDRWSKHDTSAIFVDGSVKVGFIQTVTASPAFIKQAIANPAQYEGSTITFSTEVEELAANRADILISYWVGSTQKVAKSQILKTGITSVSATIPNGITRLEVFLYGADLRYGDTVDSYTRFKWAKLEVGSIATPFIPPDPATELVKCQRYYYQSWEGENPSTSGVLCVPAITKTRTMSIDYPVEMAKKPTIMICTSDGAENAVKAWSSGDIVSDVATHYVSTKRFIVGNESSSFVAGAGYGFHYSASAEP